VTDFGMNTDACRKVGLNEAIGNQALCAWQPERGVVWVQTREPRHARRLGQRRDGRLVAREVGGGYLRTYEFQRSLGWAARLMKRYLTAMTATNEASGSANCPRRSRMAGFTMGKG
jgi:hypothetical protein